MSVRIGILYVVATPIGNLLDLSPRAQQTLASVERVAAEDTRHSGALLRHFGIHTPLVSVHEHNERDRCAGLVGELLAGQSLALVSDAGTPLISDPGYHLVRAAQAAGIEVVAVPGPSSLIAALSVSGLPTDRFVFEGFLPARAAARRARLSELAAETRTLVLFESSHRIAESLADLAETFGPAREAAIARELTKRYESVRRAGLGALAAHFAASEEERRGEFVVLVQGAEAPDAGVGADAGAERVLRLLLAELPLGRAVALAAKITGARRNVLYARALELSGDGASGA